MEAKANANGNPEVVTKRIKTGEDTELDVTVPVNGDTQKKEYGGLECEPKGVIEMSYIKALADCDNLNSLEKHIAEFPDNIFQTDKIKGLKDPKINLYFTPMRLRFYLQVSIARKAPNFDDIEELIKKHFTEEDVDRMFTQDLDEFKTWVGEELTPFTLESKEIVTFHDKHNTQFEVRKIKQDQTDFWKKHNTNYQCYLFLDIDNTSVIEEDYCWEYYLLFDKSGENLLLAGFVTVYRSYHSLSRYRTRISQFAILPQYQKRGLATSLFSIIYQRFLEKAGCFEITIESPTPVMSKIEANFLLKHLLKTDHLDKLLTPEKDAFIKVGLDNIEKAFKLTIEERKAMANTVKNTIIKITRTYESLLYYLFEQEDEKTSDEFDKLMYSRFFTQFSQDLLPQRRFERLEQSSR